MPKPGQTQSSRALDRRWTAHRAEREFPYIVELVMPKSGLGVSLSCEVTRFHSSRNIPLRFGRTRQQNGRLFCRYCFSDPRQAETFRAQFADEAGNQ